MRGLSLFLLYICCAVIPGKKNERERLEVSERRISAMMRRTLGGMLTVAVLLMMRLMVEADQV